MGACAARRRRPRPRGRAAGECALQRPRSRALLPPRSPRSDLEPLLATTGDTALDELFVEAGARVLAAGHTHLQLLRPHGDSLLVNPGSVGLPLGATTSSTPPLPNVAEYALLTVSDGQVEVAFRRLPTDVDALRAASAAMPRATWASDLEQRIRRWNARPSR
jgi:diadenosine tetraphosphatase ApaH/serine/threonine PP2A family protein phosphatase